MRIRLSSSPILPAKSREPRKDNLCKGAAEAPGWQGARNEHTPRYVSDERRCQPGWIGRAPARVIFEQRPTLRLRRFPAPIPPRTAILQAMSASGNPALGPFRGLAPYDESSASLFF